MVSLVSRLTVLAPFQEHFTIHEHDPGDLEKMWVLFQWTLVGTQAPKCCQCLEYHGIKSLLIRQNPLGDFLKMQILRPLPGASGYNPRVVGLEVFVFNKFRRFFWWRTLLCPVYAYISYPLWTQEESLRLIKCQGWRGFKDHPAQPQSYWLALPEGQQCCQVSPACWQQSRPSQLPQNTALLCHCFSGCRFMRPHLSCLLLCSQSQAQCLAQGAC